jgi:hypothetical protein
MKIVRNTPEQLIIEETPWVLGIMLVFFILAFVGPGLFLVTQGEVIGLFFAAVGGGLGVMGLVVFVQRVQVILDTTTDEVIVRRRSVLRYTQEVHPLSELAEAQLDTTRGSKGTIMNRPVLIFDRGMSAGPLPIIASYTSGQGPRRAVSAINGWLQATRGRGAGRRGTGS